MNIDEKCQAIDNIKTACAILGIPEASIDSILGNIAAHIPNDDDAEHLPAKLLTGFGPIDYLLAPIYSNSRIHIYGRAGSGKTAIITHIIRCIIAKYNVDILWLDSTYKLSEKFFQGFNIGTKLNFIQTATITDDVMNIIASNKYRIIVIDDVASFKNESSANLEKIMFYCKSHRVLVFIANQIRVVPSSGKIYSSKQELITQYDINLHISKYKANYNSNYSDYELKMVFHHGTGRMDGANVIIPISTRGFVLDDLMNSRLDRMAKAAMSESFDKYIDARMRIE